MEYRIVETFAAHDWPMGFGAIAISRMNSQPAGLTRERASHLPDPATSGTVGMASGHCVLPPQTMSSLAMATISGAIHFRDRLPGAIGSAMGRVGLSSASGR